MGSMDTPSFAIDGNVERIIVHDWMGWIIRVILARSGPKKVDPSLLCSIRQWSRLYPSLENLNEQSYTYTVVKSRGLGFGDYLGVLEIQY